MGGLVGMGANTSDSPHVLDSVVIAAGTSTRGLNERGTNVLEVK